ncbi:MAG: hypothetical protein ACOY31_06540 [Bacillota bacterium]
MLKVCGKIEDLSRLEPALIWKAVEKVHFTTFFLEVKAKLD